MFTPNNSIGEYAAQREPPKHGGNQNRHSKNMTLLQYFHKTGPFIFYHRKRIVPAFKLD